jgi:hypothetical protein
MGLAAVASLMVPMTARPPDPADARGCGAARTTVLLGHVRIPDVRSGIRTWLPWRQTAILAGLIAWGVAVIAGFLVLADHAAAPGAPALAPTVWPHTSTLARDARRPTLVALLHPQCPCSRATVAELERLATRLPGRFAIDAVLLAPADDQAAWDDAAMRGALAALPGARVYEDPGGVETSRFGGRTSGQILLYGTDGRLRFAGGVTPARGHEGASFGADAIAAAVLDAAPAATGTAHAATSPVFGCSLGGAAHVAPVTDVRS